MNAERNVPIEVVVIGGGVGALELVLALHKLAEERIHTTLIAPEPSFSYRAASVAVPFDRGEVSRFSIADLAASVGADLLETAVAAVDTTRRVVRTHDGRQVGYDALVVACGAQRVPVMEGAIGFRGEEDIPAMRTLLDELEGGRVRLVAFALPQGASWALPLYELALLTATHLARKGIRGVSMSLVTPEPHPLAQFGGEVSQSVAAMLAARGINVFGATYPVGFYDGLLMLVPARTLPVDRVVCIPAARGVCIDGLPHDYEGFLTTDPLGRVRDLPDVYAIGDITNQPIKQGGIAAQQADVVAQHLAHEAGAPIEEPAPHRPVLRGLLLTGKEPQYLEAHPSGGRGATEVTSTEPLWWPGGKIAAKYLGAYLVQASRDPAAPSVH
jgi:sulfide:quinone oxidoreductase